MVSDDEADSHETADEANLHETDDEADSHETDDAATPSDPQKANHYRHRDGTDEIVFAAEEGHVLTIREYRSVEDFERAVADAEFVGTHEGVADLPGVEAFEGDERTDE